MITSMNNTYINALLADASYVALSGANGLLGGDKILENLTARLTEPLADFITKNFEVVNQTGSTDGALSFGGFGATVWRGKSKNQWGQQLS